MPAAKMIAFQDLPRVRQHHAKERIVHCHGVFDLLHHGHLLHLNSARKFGDVLVVTVTPDHFVNKGPGRPRFDAQRRAEMLAALEVVDYVAINEYPKAIEPIGVLRPDVFAKGPDYQNKQTDITGNILEEEEAVNAVGGVLRFTDDPKESSTTLINRYFAQWDEKQAQAIERVRELLGLEGVLELVERLAGKRVFVVGEPIIDTYVFCQAEGLSSKSPTVSARMLYQEDFAGGALAIANHLAALGCDVRLLLTHGTEQLFQDLLAQTMNPSVDVTSVTLPGIPTPRKTRYIVPFRNQHIFEMINLRADQWHHADPAPFIAKLDRLGSDSDVTIVADFGHGLFEGPALEAVGKLNHFKAVNVQTNSANFGFNVFRKHRNYHYLSIDERECRLGMHDRFSGIADLATRAVGEEIRTRASVTLGTEGAMYFDGDGNAHLCPTFFRDARDSVGAGDAYFALTSLLVQEGVAAPVVPFLGNLFAGLQAQIIGNKRPVEKTEFIRAIQSVLQ